MTRPARSWIPSLCCVLAVGCAGPALSWGDLEDRASAPGLRRYHDGFYAELGTSWTRGATMPEFRERLARCDALLLGDYHTDRELHRAHLGLIQSLAENGLRGVLLLEAVGTQDQPAVDAFLAGELDLNRLRRRLSARWGESWLDNDDVDDYYFRELLHLARSLGWPVRCLEPTPRLPLAERDARMTRSLAAAIADFPDRTPVVVVGQTHLVGRGRIVDRFAGRALVVAARTNASLTGSTPLAPPSSTFVISDRDVWFLKDHIRPRPARDDVRSDRTR